ncbi:MAG: DUF962 domain-containing protein [Burkholderiales bacterium]
MSASTYKNFRDFYPFYLSEHQNFVCRRLHFVGTSLVIGIVLATIIHNNYSWIWLALVAGYGFAWIGHFVFEKNRPATFKYPFYSFIGDWVMYKDILVGNIKF